MTVQEYMDNPCRASSLPYWKTLSYDVPENMLIIHNDDFCKNKYNNYTDECYFRLINYLDKNYNFEIPYGYSLIESPIEVFSDHINSCYDDIMVTYQIVKGFTERQVYDEELWVAVVCDQTKEIVATGIAEYDLTIGEGIIEWIEVSASYRGIGLGKFVVNELLNRMKNKAVFVTVSGKVGIESNPESLYRKCGFTGNDIWHILRRIER